MQFGRSSFKPMSLIFSVPFKSIVFVESVCFKIAVTFSGAVFFLYHHIFLKFVLNVMWSLFSLTLEDNFMKRIDLCSERSVVN